MSSTNLRFIKMVYALGIILVVMFMGCAQQVHEHVYKDTVIAPTCAEKGYTLHKCQTCGDEYKDTYIPMVDHTFEDKEITKNATCTEPGEKVVVCNICNSSKPESIDPLGHDYDKWKQIKDEKNNYTHTHNRFCKRCNKEDGPEDCNSKTKCNKCETQFEFDFDLDL